MGPNGSGKSTLIEAISWVLFGSGSVDRTDKEGIKRSGAGPNEDCSVSLIFELGGVQYQVKRTMRGKNLKADAQLLANGEVLASSERSVTSEVEKILGMDHRAFFLSVFARQKDLSALSALQPAERKKHIIRMLDLDVLQDVIDDIKRDKRDEENKLKFVSDQLLTADLRPKREVLEEERAALVEEISTLNHEMEEARRELERLKVELKKAKGSRDEVAAKEEEYRGRERRLAKKRAELEGLIRQRADLEKDIASLEQRLASLPELKARKEEYDELLKKKDAMEESRRAYERRKTLLESLERDEREIAIAEGNIAKYSEERRGLRDLQGSLAKVSENLGSLELEVQEAKERISVAETEVRGLQRDLEGLESKRLEIESLGPASVCPTCQRTLGDHHERLIATLDDQGKNIESSIMARNEEIRRWREELQIIQKRRDVLEDRKRKLQADDLRCRELDVLLEQVTRSLDSLKEHRASLIGQMDALGDVDFDEGAYQTVKERLLALRADAERFQALSGEAVRLPEMKARKEDLCTSIELREDELIGMQADLAAVGYEEGDLKEAQERYANALRALEAGQGKVQEKIAAIHQVEKRLQDKDDAIAEIAEMERREKECARKVQELVKLERVMGDFKQNLMERITPTLSEIASELFDTMTDSRYGGIEVDENYEIQIYDGGEKYPLSRFSGGEGDLANLCLRLAISRVLADRSGNDMNFLVLDEIFGSQDQVRKRAIMETLNRLEKRFHQIVLITHIDDTKDMMSNVVTVKELDDGTSDLVV